MTQQQSFLGVLRSQQLAGATALAVVLLAGINWIQDPAQAERWFRAMLTLPLILLVATLLAVWAHRSNPTDDDLSRQRYFNSALTLLVLAVGIRQIALFGLEIWVRTGNPSADLEFERRLLGLASATVFIVIGNTLPKILTPLSILPLHLAERVTSARRFVGTVGMILGVLMAIGFIAMPLTLAKAFERWSVILGLLTILGAIVWMNARPAQRGEE